MKKNSIIVFSFSILVITVLGVVIYNSNRNNVSSNAEVSSTSTIASSEPSIYIPSTYSKRAVVVVGEKVEDMTPYTQNLKGVVEDPKELDSNSKNKNKDLDTTPPSLDFTNKEQMDNGRIVLPIDEADPSKSKIGVLPYQPPIDLNLPVTPNPPIYKNPVPAPLPYTPTIPPYKPSYPSNPVVTRRMSYDGAMSRLSARGSDIAVPIANYDLYQLDFSADSDLNNVLSYEYELNSKTKNYGIFGSKQHLDSLKCERNIPSCQIIMRRSNTGRYYISLGIIKSYIK